MFNGLISTLFSVLDSYSFLLEKAKRKTLSVTNLPTIYSGKLWSYDNFWSSAFKSISHIRVPEVGIVMNVVDQTSSILAWIVTVIEDIWKKRWMERCNLEAEFCRPHWQWMSQVRSRKYSRITSQFWFVWWGRWMVFPFLYWKTYRKRGPFEGKDKFSFIY